jgi:diguanylate cyclase (GGDEF)-like protein
LYDDITALPNRRLLESRLTSGAQSSTGRRSTGVLVIDIDDFTNSTMRSGHRVGDALLQQVATRLIDTVRTSDWWRGSVLEFAVVLGACAARTA